MEFEPGSISQLSQFISHVVAPAFLLGAVGNFISILMGRMDGVMARLRFINDLPAEDYAKSLLRVHIPRLRRRAKLLPCALYLSIATEAMMAEKPKDKAPAMPAGGMGGMDF